MTITEIQIELPRAIERARMAWAESESFDYALCAKMLQPLQDLLERLDTTFPHDAGINTERNSMPELPGQNGTSTPAIPGQGAPQTTAEQKAVIEAKWADMVTVQEIKSALVELLDVIGRHPELLEWAKASKEGTING